MPNRAFDRGKQKIPFWVPYALRNYHRKLVFYDSCYTDSDPHYIVFLKT